VLVLEQALNGLQYGVMLFLMAAGLTLVFGIMNLVNLAHGSLYMVGAYLAAACYKWTGSFPLAAVLALIGTLLVGVVVELIALRTLYERDHLDQVLATFARFTKEDVDQSKLDATRSRMRYSFALRMNSSPAIAAALAPYVLLRRTPDTINKVFALYQQVTPEDIRAIAATYLTENNRTIVTLATKAGTQ